MSIDKLLFFWNSIKFFFGRFLHFLFVNNAVIRFISLPLFSVIVPPLLTLYYGTLDIWGDDWPWIKNHKSEHELIYSIMVLTTVGVLSIKGISEQAKGHVNKNYQNILETMILFFNSLVKKKKDRFFQKAKSIKKPKCDIFNIITQPQDQIEFVLDGIKDMLYKIFEIEKKNIGITIIEGDHIQNKWWYAFTCDSQRQHTKAQDLMNNKSTAKHCYDKGDSIFIPALESGIKAEVFYVTERAKNHKKIGSIYCKPVRITVGNRDFVYVFSICIYGQFLCTPYDEEECKACERLCDEIADRIELELYLRSIKTFKSSINPNPTGGVV